MDRSEGNPTPPRKPRSALAWIVAAAIVILLIILALQGMIRGGGEAAGVQGAAPGGDNVSGAPPESDL